MSFSIVKLPSLHLLYLTLFSQHLTAESEMEEERVEGESWLGVGVYPYISATLFLFSAKTESKRCRVTGWRGIYFKIFLNIFLMDQYACCLFINRNLASFRPGKSKVIIPCTSKSK